MTSPIKSSLRQIPYAATAAVPDTAMIVVMARNATLLIALWMADGIAITTISLISFGSNVHFFGNLIGLFFLDGRRYITPIRSSTPIALERSDAYAEPAIPQAGRQDPE